MDKVRRAQRGKPPIDTWGLLLELSRVTVLAREAGDVRVRDGLRELMRPLRTELGMTGGLT